MWAGGGSGTLVHWDGETWSAVSTGNQLYVFGVFAPASNDVWGVGNGGNRLHWDGSTVTVTTEGWVGYDALAGTSASDIWGVGSCCWDEGKTSALLSYFDGSVWTDHRLEDFDGGFADVKTTPTGRYYALGWDNTPAHPATEFLPVRSRLYVLRP